MEALNILQLHNVIDIIHVHNVMHIHQRSELGLSTLAIYILDINYSCIYMWYPDY